MSPIYRQNIYVGAFEELKPDQTPVDFFYLDTDRFPFIADVPFLEATLTPGDCIYVPAFFYVWSRSLGATGLYSSGDPVLQKAENESIILTWQFAAHSHLVDMLLVHGLEEQGIIDDATHSWDKSLYTFLDNFY